MDPKIHEMLIDTCHRVDVPYLETVRIILSFLCVVEPLENNRAMRLFVDMVRQFCRLQDIDEAKLRTDIALVLKTLKAAG